MNLTFKQLFPRWQDFYKFLNDYSIYRVDENLTQEKAMVYHTILFRRYANSHIAYDYEVFFDQLSILVSEHFNAFFKVKDMIDFINGKAIKELLVGMETIVNAGENNNTNIDKDDILPYIGSQSRSRSQGNVVEVIHAIIPKVRIKEITYELDQYAQLFIQIIPTINYYYGDPNSEYEDYSYGGEDYEIT